MIAHTGPAPRLRAAVLVTVALLLAGVGVAWWQTVSGAAAMPMVDGLAQAGREMPFDPGPLRFAGMWTVMIAAMMLPGVIPVVATQRGDRLGHPLAGAATAVGYLAVWTPTGLVAFAVLTVLNDVGQPTAWLGRVGGAIIALAGAYQFTAVKRRLLDSYCRPGVDAGGFRAGLAEGVRCLGCSWALMSVLLVVGVMNLGWMAAIGAICLGEKILKRRAALAIGVGVALIACGLVVTIFPAALDVIGARSL